MTSTAETAIKRQAAPRAPLRPNSDRAEKLDLDAILAFAECLAHERDTYSLAAAANATLAQDPVTVAARVVRDLWTLGQMAIKEGREAEATTIAVTHGTMRGVLNAANARGLAKKETPR